MITDHCLYFDAGWDQYFAPPQRRVYISGPMTGIPDWNYPAFNEAAARWRAAKWHVENPAENFGGRTDLPYHVNIREDINQLLRVDAIALLPGWSKSRGARFELRVAQMLELEVYDTTNLDFPISMPTLPA